MVIVVLSIPGKCLNKYRNSNPDQRSVIGNPRSSPKLGKVTRTPSISSRCFGTDPHTSGIADSFLRCQTLFLPVSAHDIDPFIFSGFLRIDFSPCLTKWSGKNPCYWRSNQVPSSFPLLLPPNKFFSTKTNPYSVPCLYPGLTTFSFFVHNKAWGLVYV